MKVKIWTVDVYPIEMVWIWAFLWTDVDKVALLFLDQMANSSSNTTTQSKVPQTGIIMASKNNKRKIPPSITMKNIIHSILMARIITSMLMEELLVKLLQVNLIPWPKAPIIISKQSAVTILNMVWRWEVDLPLLTTQVPATRLSQWPTHKALVDSVMVLPSPTRLNSIQECSQQTRLSNNKKRCRCQMDRDNNKWFWVNLSHIRTRVRFKLVYQWQIFRLGNFRCWNQVKALFPKNRCETSWDLKYTTKCKNDSINMPYRKTLLTIKRRELWIQLISLIHPDKTVQSLLEVKDKIWFRLKVTLRATPMELQTWSSRNLLTIPWHSLLNPGNKRR